MFTYFRIKSYQLRTLLLTALIAVSLRDDCVILY